MKPSSAGPDKLINRTIELWRPRLHDLSREDARQIVENVAGFFTILAEWFQAEMSTLANDTSAQTETTGGEVLNGR